MRTDFLTPDYLASAHIDTPDPCGPCFYGEQIVVRYAFPKSCLREDPLLQLTIRFKDRSLETLSIPLCKARGYYIYQIIDGLYFEKGGILSYKAQILTSSGEEILEWRHHIWADIVNLGD